MDGCGSVINSLGLKPKEQPKEECCGGSSCCKNKEFLKENETVTKEITAHEVYNNKIIFDLIKDIMDPEHPYTLEDLKVVQEELVAVNDKENWVKVSFTPTIPYCSMAALIGLSIRVQLLRSLPTRFKVNVEITPGTHNAEEAVNKQLADKERVAAALDNIHLRAVIDQCIEARNKG